MHGNMFLRRRPGSMSPVSRWRSGNGGTAQQVLADLRVRGFATGSHSGSMSGPFV
jgi:hypothetical protein